MVPAAFARRSMNPAQCPRELQVVALVEVVALIFVLEGLLLYYVRNGGICPYSSQSLSLRVQGPKYRGFRAQIPSIL